MTAAAYGPDHPRYEAARRFGVAFSKAMATRQLRPFHLFKAIGGGVSGFQLQQWMKGYALPSVEKAELIAKALDEPRLLEMVIAGRTGTCARQGCGRTFISNTGKSRLYCTPRCYQLVHEYQLPYSHARRKKLSIDEATVAQVEAERRILEDEVRDHRAAVANFCRECEPEGICRDAHCALRGLSPLPVRRARPDSVEARVRMPNRWGPKQPEKASA